MNSSTETTTAPRFHRWRIRKELPDGMFTCCEFNARVPMTAEDVRTSPAVIEWLGNDRIDDIYHPEPENAALSATPAKPKQTL